MAESRQHHTENGLATPALVLGIIAFVTAFIPFVNFVSGAIGLIGLILGIVALVKNKQKGLAVAGTVISAVAGVLSIIMIITYTAIFFGVVGSAINQTNEEMNAPVTVTYEVTGAGKNVSVTYSTYANGTSGTEQVTSAELPFTKTVEGTKGWSSYSITATNGFDDDADVSCSIKINDEVVVSRTSSGKFATVSCFK